MKYLLLMATLISLNVVTARNKIFRHYTPVVKKADTVVMYVLEATPVEKQLQDTTKNYIADYPVITIQSVTGDKKAALQKAVLHKAAYLTDAMKRCPFVAKYAIVFQKGNRKVMLIISPAPCSKVMVYLPGQTTGQPYDLAQLNAIEVALQQQ